MLSFTKVIKFWRLMNESNDEYGTLVKGYWQGKSEKRETRAEIYSRATFSNTSHVDCPGIELALPHCKLAADVLTFGMSTYYWSLSFRCRSTDVKRDLSLNCDTVCHCAYCDTVCHCVCCDTVCHCVYCDTVCHCVYCDTVCHCVCCDTVCHCVYCDIVCHCV